MRGILEELVFVFKSLDKETNIKLLTMLVVTIGLSILFFTQIENPVIEGWKEDRQTQQQLEERREKREETIEEREAQRVEKEKASAEEDAKLEDEESELDEAEEEELEEKEVVF